nr:MAG TPA: hypothetical protein [Caudoviricetes sp.]DAW54498.1 MAG TPA: hypothetical protein [Caudoviricetes sp.]
MGRYTVITSTLSLRISTHCKYTIKIRYFQQKQRIFCF